MMGGRQVAITGSHLRCPHHSPEQVSYLRCVLVFVSMFLVASSFVGCDKQQSDRPSTVADFLHVPPEVHYSPQSAVPIHLPDSPSAYWRVSRLSDSGLVKGFCVAGQRGGRGIGANCYDAAQVDRSNAIQTVEAPDGRFDVIGLVPSSVRWVRLKFRHRTRVVRARDGYFAVRTDHVPISYRF